MWIVAFQLATIVSLVAFVIAAGSELMLGRTCGNACETLWVVRAQRMGGKSGIRRKRFFKNTEYADTIALPEDVFLMGNRLWDDIYIDTGGGRIKLYLNVQKDKILLSVLEGQVVIHNRVAEKNGCTTMEIQDFTKIIVGELFLQFQRKRGR